MDEELLPQRIIELDVIGTRNKRYRGTFTYRVPTLAMSIAIGRRKAELLGDKPVATADIFSAALAEQIAYLEVTLEGGPKLPEWWKPLEMYDSTPVAALYQEAASYEARFHGREPLQRKNPAPPARADHDASGDDPEGSVEVGGNVSPAAERQPIVFSDSARGD